jgi:flagellar hook-associated protein 2
MSSVSALNSLLSSTTPTTPTTVNISSILAAAVGATTPGIDVSAAVAAAISAARAPERIWQAEQATLTSQTTALTAIQAATNALTADMASLNTLTGPLSARTVTSSNPNAVTATAATGTVTGNHSVVVQNLATTGSWFSDLAASPTAALPASSFTITTKAGGSATITTGSGVNTLNDVATSINAQNLGVTATVVSDSTGSRLAIISNSSGSASDFSITSAPYTGTSWSSQSIPSSSTLGANSFTLTSGGTTTTISTTSGETYAQLASDINGRLLGVTASVVSDSTGSHLTIASSDGTTPFTISEPSFGYSQAAAGANANLTVDGVPISSATNTVTGAVNGVTLNLLSATSGGTINLTVASDAAKVSTAINQFVSDYNTAIGLVNSQFTFNGATSSQGVLGSDPTVRSLQNSLMQVLNYVNLPATGISTVPTLSSLGITAASDGTLSVDSATLNSALINNASGVQNFFQGASLNGFANSLTTQLSNFTNPGSGAFTVDLNSISKTNADLTKQISDFESIFIANQQTLLTAMYSQAEIALQQLPTQMAQIQAELGNTTKSGG